MGSAGGLRQYGARAGASYRSLRTCIASGHSEVEFTPSRGVMLCSQILGANPYFSRLCPDPDKVDALSVPDLLYVLITRLVPDC